MAESRMELFIETLTGTAFELSCSPLETVASIKAKIQYSEGIPIAQQHLIWKSEELDNDLCLQDYCISDGSTLKLVLGLRGGPINTRQVSDSKKLKDLAEFVERRSETSGSNGQPFTVLVFHDGDKVHMYTLTESGECTPVSTTVSHSETSSIASIKNIEELDQEIIRENSITREKIADLQKQLKALNINKSRRITNAGSSHENSSHEIPPAENFKLPPLQRVGAIDSLPTHSFRSDIKKIPNPYCAAAGPSTSKKASHDKVKANKDIRSSHKPFKYAECAAIDLISEKVSTFLLASPGNSPDESRSSRSKLLPSSVVNAQDQCSSSHRLLPSTSFSNPQVASIKVNSSLGTIIKHDPSRSKRNRTGHKSFEQQSFTDLDNWLLQRPKTSPEKSGLSTLCNGKPALRNKAKGNCVFKPETKTRFLTSEAKSEVTMHFPNDCQEVPLDLSQSYASNRISTSSLKHHKNEFPAQRSSPQDSLIQEVCSAIINNSKMASNKITQCSQQPSENSLPLIKPKKKLSTRCSLCSKKTGLATNYICRCGKNFCASHRYAETHRCTYDYKTEGRKLLELNNPVITASKLPKI